MTCEQTIRVGDIGTRLEIEVLQDCAAPLDLSTAGAAAQKITIERPDGTTVTKDSVFSTDGTDGKIYFETESGHLTMAGTYKIQAFISVPAPWSGYSSIGEFEVHKNLG